MQWADPGVSHHSGATRQFHGVAVLPRGPLFEGAVSVGELGRGGTPTEARELEGESRLAYYRVDWLAIVMLKSGAVPIGR